MSASFLCYGLRIGISVDRLGLLTSVRRCLPPPTRSIWSSTLARHYRVTSTWRGRVQVHQGRRRLAQAMELEPALDLLESDLQLFVAEKAHDRLFVHAGVVGWRGRAIVLPGRSMSGKSTLVAALGRCCP